MMFIFARFDLESLLSRPARVLVPLLFVIALAVTTPYPLLAIPAAAATVSIGAGTPFLNDERGSLDILYATLPIRRQVVVVGRYLEMTIWYLLFASIATAAAVVVSEIRQITFYGETLLMFQVLSFLGVTIALSIQLPVFFAVGFTRARSLMFIPVIVIAAAVSAAIAESMQVTLFRAVQTDIFTVSVCVLAGLISLGVSAIVASFIYSRRQL